MLNTALEEEVIAAAITVALVVLYLYTSDVHPVAGLGLGGGRGKTRRGPSDDVIILSQP